MSTYEIEHLSLAEAILSRPKMYTANGSLPEIFALFEGFDAAIRMTRGCTDESPSDIIEWVSEECSIERYSTTPVQQITRMIEKFGDEKRVLNAMKDYARDRRKQGESSQ